MPQRPVYISDVIKVYLKAPVSHKWFFWPYLQIHVTEMTFKGEKKNLLLPVSASAGVWPSRLVVAEQTPAFISETLEFLAGRGSSLSITRADCGPACMSQSLRRSGDSGVQRKTSRWTFTDRKPGQVDSVFPLGELT